MNEKSGFRSEGSGLSSLRDPESHSYIRDEA